MTQTPADFVEQYLMHVNAHELELAMACLDDAFHLAFAGSDFAMPKAGARQTMEWDVGTNGQLTWRVEASRGAEVHVVGHESNEFLQLIGIGRLPFRARFDVAEGAIIRQVHEVDWGGRSVDEALKPVVRWASVHEPEELAAIYPKERLEYTRDSGRRWVALFRRWRAATV